MRELMTPLDGRANPCLCCPPITATLDLDCVIAVGFGYAACTRDGLEMLAERDAADGQYPTVREAETLALADPDHDWRIILDGPLHGETYQRQGEGRWVLVAKNEGFA